MLHEYVTTYPEYQRSDQWAVERAHLSGRDLCGCSQGTGLAVFTDRMKQSSQDPILLTHFFELILLKYNHWKHYKKNFLRCLPLFCSISKYFCVAWWVLQSLHHCNVFILNALDDKTHYFYWIPLANTQTALKRAFGE